MEENTNQIKNNIIPKIFPQAVDSYQHFCNGYILNFMKTAQPYSI